MVTSPMRPSVAVLDAIRPSSPTLRPASESCRTLSLGRDRDLRLIGAEVVLEMPMRRAVLEAGPRLALARRPPPRAGRAGPLLAERVGRQRLDVLDRHVDVVLDDHV